MGRIIKGVVRSYDLGADPVTPAGEGTAEEKRRKHNFAKQGKVKKLTPKKRKN